MGLGFKESTVCVCVCVFTQLRALSPERVTKLNSLMLVFLINRHMDGLQNGPTGHRSKGLRDHGAPLQPFFIAESKDTENSLIHVYNICWI